MKCGNIWLFLLCSFSVSSFTSATYGLDSGGELNLLIFGGNGFMGATLSEKLIAKGASLTLLNRGNWYWDSGVTVKPFVRHLKCDRYESLRRCSDVQLLLKEDDSVFFDAVIDFSAYHPDVVSDALDIFRGRIGRYIYISSDSVYEVCEKFHNEHSRETDDVRPESPDVREKLNQKDDYGNRKLESEEVLIHQKVEDAVPYVSLRLPDVIGPRDNTYRWWIYQMWIKLHMYLERPVSVPEHIWTQPLSLVYSNDVADIIIDMLNSDLKIFNQSYNLAFEETPTLFDLLTLIKDILGLQEPEIRSDSSANAIYLFPSVRLGPIDISKADRYLKWRPTSLRKAVTEIVMFYEKAVVETKFDRERFDVIQKLQTHFTSNANSVLIGLQKEYHSREEL